MSDLKEFKLPDVGEGLTEADIVRWHVRPGDQITVNQIIVEIETAKAVVELPSPYAGTVADLLVAEGTTADVGTPIISVNVGGSAPAAATAVPEEALVPPEAIRQREISEAEDLIPAPPIEGASEPGMIGSPAPKAERQAVLVGYGVKLGTTARRARKTAGSAPAPAAAPPATRAPAAPADTEPDTRPADIKPADIGPGAAATEVPHANGAR